MQNAMNVRKLFDECATVYDRDRPMLIPSFDDLYGTALRVIPFAAEAAIDILDLGAGTGLLGAMLVKQFPAARLHLTDISEAMLAQAKQRFGDSPQVTYSVQEHLALPAAPQYDLVASALSIHHLDDSDKRALVHRIFAALRPGGMFVNIDQALGPSPQGEAEYERLWIEEAMASGISLEAMQQARERKRADKNALLADQLAWLAEAGFEGIDCWYKRFRFVVYGGYKR